MRMVLLNVLYIGNCRFTLLQIPGKEVSKADFARLQRESLETYFIKLIRAVVR